VKSPSRKVARHLHAVPELGDPTPDSGRTVPEAGADEAGSPPGQEPPDPEPEPLVAVLDAISTHIARFVALTPVQLDAVVLWVAHTHVAERFDHTPRLAVVSPELGSGKTILMSVIETLVPRPMVMVSPTASVLFHEIDAAPEDSLPTILMDEVDEIFRPGGGQPRKDIVALINTGHRKGTKVPRMISRTEVHHYRVFAPLAMFGLKTVPDTIRSRSVVIRMKRRSRDQELDRARSRVLTEQGEELHQRMIAALSAVQDILAAAEPVIPDEIDNRDADVWEPLLAIAGAAGGAWPERARVTAVTLVTDAKDRGESDGITLLRDTKGICHAIQEKGTTDRITSKELLAKLKDFDGSPWGRSSFTYRALSDMLREFDIKPKPLNTGDTTARGYLWESFTDAWSRYLPS